MKKDWTYKKLGEVAEIEYGTRVVQKKDGGSIYPVYGGGGATFKMDTYNREDRLVIARFAMSPKCTRFVSGKFFLNDSGLTLKANDCLFTPYLNWHIIALNDEIYHTAKGAAQKNLDIKAFTSLKIAIPPLSIQRSIVAELDLLHSVISKKKEQLRELDNLAQSLFYQMFGDPITNPMGWEQRKIGLFAQLVAGATPSTTVDAYWENGSIPWLSSGEVSKGRIYETDNKITQKGYDNCSTKLIPPHTLIMALAGQGKTRGTVGIAEIALCTNQSICSFLTDNTINVDYMYYLLKYEYDYLRGFSNGDGGRGGLNLRILRNLSIITPPLSLQQSFAAKVSAIEVQKQAITQSIHHTETLLAQRMDQYFA